MTQSTLDETQNGLVEPARIEDIRAASAELAPRRRGYDRRYHKVEAPAPYEGYWVEVWANYPNSLILQIQRATENNNLEDAANAFQGTNLVRSWNLTDFDGNDLPVPGDDPRSLMLIPGDLFGWIFQAIGEAPSRAVETDSPN